MCHKPQKGTSWQRVWVLYMVVFWNHRFLANKKNQPKARVQPLKWENWQRVEAEVLHFCVGLPALQTTNNEPENKKPKHQKNKKPKNQKTKKTKKHKIAHPKGEVVAEGYIGFVIFFVLFLFSCFFCFFVLWVLVCSVCLVWFSHCRDAKQKLSMVAQ